MTRAEVHRWTSADHPAPWEYSVHTAHGMVHGHACTWRRAYDRTLQIISDLT